jgi:hypothetical protein
VPAPALRFALVAWLALALGALLVVVPAPRTPTASASPSLQALASHPYSDPVWFPLRAPASVGCAKSGCGTSADHDYDAIDWLGKQGDPVYAAGAGVAHVGGNSGSCSGSGEVEGGRWVWVDHGGGVVSRYHHLDSVAIKEGQLVTPAVRIGAMGHSGDVPPCTVNYLHFEVRHGGVRGERADFGSLRGCGSNGPVQLPQAFGFSSWNAPGLHPARRLTTPRLDSSCLTADWTTTSTSPAPRLGRSDGAVHVAVDVPQGAQEWVVRLEIWRPSIKTWRTLAVATVPAGTSSTVFRDDVENGRRYRVQAAVHQGRGWSRWSEAREVLGTPAAPGLRYLQWKKQKSKKKSYLHYGWQRPEDFGSAVTGYTLQRRCGAKADSLGAWKTSGASAKTAYKNLRGLKKVKVCEVRIRATNAVGAGAWSAPERVRR